MRLVKDVSSKTTTNPESSALYTKAKGSVWDGELLTSLRTSRLSSSDCLKKWTRLTSRIHRLLKLSQIHLDIIGKLRDSLKSLNEMEEKLNLSANLDEEEKSRAHQVRQQSRKTYELIGS